MVGMSVVLDETSVLGYFSDHPQRVKKCSKIYLRANRLEARGEYVVEDIHNVRNGADDYEGECDPRCTREDDLECDPRGVGECGLRDVGECDSGYDCG